MSDWKEKLKGYCSCFSGDDNKLGLIINTNVCDCSANDLKFLLYSKRQRIVVPLAIALIKLNIYTSKELKIILQEITKRSQKNGRAITRAKARLKKAEYHTYYDEDKVLKCYDKNKL